MQLRQMTLLAPCHCALPALPAPWHAAHDSLAAGLVLQQADQSWWQPETRTPGSALRLRSGRQRPCWQERVERRRLYAQYHTPTELKNWLTSVRCKVGLGPASEPSSITAVTVRPSRFHCKCSNLPAKKLIVEHQQGCNARFSTLPRHLKMSGGCSVAVPGIAYARGGTAELKVRSPTRPCYRHSNCASCHPWSGHQRHGSWSSQAYRCDRSRTNGRRHRTSRCHQWPAGKRQRRRRQRHSLAYPALLLFILPFKRVVFQLAGRHAVRLCWWTEQRSSWSGRLRGCARRCASL